MLENVVDKKVGVKATTLMQYGTISILKSAI